jgi:two-component system probable response regulator PhcQ
MSDKTKDTIRILLVDDEPNVLSALQRALRGRWRGGRLAVEPHTSPLAALDALLERPADVVVSDYRMPELDGVELLRRVRELQPYAGRVLLSGTTDFSYLLSAVNLAGVTRVLIKPWIDEELVDAVRHAVDLRRLQQENAELADQVRVQRGLISAQQAELNRLESQWPGITRVRPSDDGGVLIAEGELPSGFGSLQPLDAERAMSEPTAPPG